MESVAKSNSLSIVVCTYNRTNLLCKVVKKILELTAEEERIELIVIDNNSTDSTKADLMNIAEAEKIKYFLETQQGLSYSRNRGIAEASGEWIFFLDDDGWPADDLFERLLAYVDSDRYSVIGGQYTAWYFYGKKKWSKDHYYSNFPQIKRPKVMTGNEKLSGGILMIKKELFEKAGLFDSELGMKGNQLGYGEETEMQERLQKLGYDLYFDPKLKMKHVVAEKKLNVGYFFESKKALAKSFYHYEFKDKKIYFLLAPFIALGLSVKDGVLNLFRLFKRDYFWENYIIDTFTKPYKWLQIFKSYIA